MDCMRSLSMNGGDGAMEPMHARQALVYVVNDRGMMERKGRKRVISDLSSSVPSRPLAQARPLSPSLFHSLSSASFRWRLLNPCRPMPRPCPLPAPNVSPNFLQVCVSAPFASSQLGRFRSVAATNEPERQSSHARLSVTLTRRTRLTGLDGMVLFS